MESLKPLSCRERDLCFQGKHKLHLPEERCFLESIWGRSRKEPGTIWKEKALPGERQSQCECVVRKVQAHPVSQTEGQKGREADAIGRCWRNDSVPGPIYLLTFGGWKRSQLHPET